MNARLLGAALVGLIIGYFFGRLGTSVNSACAPTLNPIPAATPSGFQRPTSSRVETPTVTPIGPSPAPARADESPVREKPKFDRESEGHPPRFIVIDFSEKTVAQMEADAVSLGREFEVRKSPQAWSFAKVPGDSVLHRLGLRDGDSIYVIQVDDLRTKRPDLESRVRAVLDRLAKF